MTITEAVIVGGVLGFLVGVVLPRGQAGADRVVTNAIAGAIAGAVVAAVLAVVLAGAVR